MKRGKREISGKLTDKEVGMSNLDSFGQDMVFWWY
jgi:hypothetical protein